MAIKLRYCVIPGKFAKYNIVSWQGHHVIWNEETSPRRILRLLINNSGLTWRELCSAVGTDPEGHDGTMMLLINSVSALQDEELIVVDGGGDVFHHRGPAKDAAPSPRIRASGHPRASSHCNTHLISIWRQRLPEKLTRLESVRYLASLSTFRSKPTFL